ncbi:hypothetical protein WN48_10650 [Eufriesea mexicana]|uniref:Uncharacterized protein n=1 Tax=Eufriesea mexicana TaxID=516756 RepID=A0A310S9M9_9HYME|nr:hypothetical protein WN48_10650 [Eufriesea mexicana]
MHTELELVEKKKETESFIESHNEKLEFSDLQSAFFRDRRLESVNKLFPLKLV